MGLYDREYMKKGQGISPSPIRKAKPRKPKSNLTWWQQFRFKLWLLFKGRKGK